MADEQPPAWAVRIETKLDMVILQKDDHEKRLRVIEQQNATVRGWLIGACTAGGLGALSGITALVNAIGG